MWSNLSGVLSPTSLEPTLATLTCGPQKYDPSLRSLLHEPIFMMQAAEYGFLYNPISDRQTMSVLVGRDLVRHGLRQTGA